MTSDEIQMRFQSTCDFISPAVAVCGFGSPPLFPTSSGMMCAQNCPSLEQNRMRRRKSSGYQNADVFVNPLKLSTNSVLGNGSRETKSTQIQSQPFHGSAADKGRTTTPRNSDRSAGPEISPFLRRAPGWEDLPSEVHLHGGPVARKVVRLLFMVTHVSTLIFLFLRNEVDWFSIGSGSGLCLWVNACGWLGWPGRGRGLRGRMHPRAHVWSRACVWVCGYGFVMCVCARVGFEFSTEACPLPIWLLTPD